MSELKQMLSLQLRLARKSGENAMADLLGNSKREIERLESQVRQMSELCLTVEEVNSIKADAVREAVKYLNEYLRGLYTVAPPEFYEHVLMEHADKLERGEL